MSGRRSGLTQAADAYWTSRSCGIKRKRSNSESSSGQTDTLLRRALPQITSHYFSPEWFLSTRSKSRDRPHQNSASTLHNLAVPLVSSNLNRKERLTEP